MSKVLVPTKLFFTNGVGVHREKLQSFELALRDAGIATLNLVSVSSIYPPGCKIISRSMGLKKLSPGQITFCVMSRLASNEPRRLMAASVGCAIPTDRKLYGYLSEHHAYGQTDAIAGDYKRFIDSFRPVVRAMRAAETLDPEQCFVIRTLLIHEFRRVQLRDPQLPKQLLPAEWPGDTARALCGELYAMVQCGAERHLLQSLETADGPLPGAAPYFYTRFGGILDPNCKDNA